MGGGDTAPFPPNIANGILPPFVRKTTICTPRRGQCGVLAYAAKAAETGEEAAIAEVAAQQREKAPYCDILPPLSDIRSIWNKDPGKTAANEALQGALDVYGGLAVIVKPWSSRTRKRQDRKRLQQHDLLEAQRALRSILPGDWNAELFCQFRRQFMEDGHWGAISGLSSIAAQASLLALKAGKYCPPPSGMNAEVKVPQHPRVQWFAFQNVANPSRPLKQPAPPLICVPLGPIDAVMEARNIFPTHFLVMSFEATDFAESGAGLLGVATARSAAQQELFIRTNLEYHLKDAHLVATGKTAHHLTAPVDPYIFAASSVMIFRGSTERGYPFFKQQETVSVNVLVSGRANARPAIGADGEHFVSKTDILAHMERLHLIALSATTLSMQDECTGHQPDKEIRHQPDKEIRKPILVISAHDLTVSGAPQPREGIANTLKSWRQLYANLFEAVIVACGDAQTASIMDKVINCSTYMSALIDSGPALPGAGGGWRTAVGTDPPVDCDFAWDERLLRLSVNGTLTEIGNRVRKSRGTVSAGRKSSIRVPVHPDSFTRASSNRERMIMLTDAHAESMSRSPSKLPKALQYDEFCDDLTQTPHDLNLASDRVSNVIGLDSRTAHNRALMNRLGSSATLGDSRISLNNNENSTEPEAGASAGRLTLCNVSGNTFSARTPMSPKKSVTALEAGAHMGRVNAVNSLTSGCFDVRKGAQNRRKQESLAEQRRVAIDTRASNLYMPEDLKSHVCGMIEASFKGKDAEIDQTEDNHHVQEEVQNMAGTLQSSIRSKRGFQEDNMMENTSRQSQMAMPREPPSRSARLPQRPLPKIGGTPPMLPSLDNIH